MKKIVLCVSLLLIIPVLLISQTKTSTSQSSFEMIRFNVSVVGNVIKPGTYSMLPTHRISDAIQAANSVKRDSMTAEVQEILDNSSTRNIKLKRKDQTIHVDLERFLRYGDRNNNPYIQDGDIIIVPAIEKKVIINGAVNRPGEFELIEEDRLLDIIMLSMGLADNAYLNKAEVVRFVNATSETEKITVNLNEILRNPLCKDNLVLRNDDRIYIRSIPEFHERKGVTISGEVKFPGSYAIKEGVTTLYDIMVQSGGPTANADLQNAYLQRKSREDIIDPEYQRLRKMLIEDMTPLEYEYFKTKSRELKGRIATNFHKLWFGNNKDYDFSLKSGDYIYIPDKSVTVTVSGQVKNPGLVTFVEGENYLYYIEKAGGFAWKARKGKIRLIKVNTGEWLRPHEDTPVEVGDMIFIPEKPEIDYWELTKDIMTIAAQIATVLIVIQNASK